MAEHKSNEDIWERLGGIASDIKNLFASHQAMMTELKAAEEKQTDHRRRLYERLDQHDERLTAIEAAHRDWKPKLERAHQFIAAADIEDARADGRKEVYSQAAEWAGRIWQAAKPALLVAAGFLGAWFKEIGNAILSLFSSPPPPPPPLH